MMIPACTLLFLEVPVEKIFCSVAQVGDGIKVGFMFISVFLRNLYLSWLFFGYSLLNRLWGNKDPAYNWEIE